MTTQQYNFFAISNEGTAGYHFSKPNLKEYQLVLQGNFYPDPEAMNGPWDDHGPCIAGKVFVVKNQPMDRKVHWFNPTWGWDRCNNTSQVPQGHVWAWTPEHCPGWVIDFLPNQTA